MFNNLGDHGKIKRSLDILQGISEDLHEHFEAHVANKGHIHEHHEHHEAKGMFVNL